MKEFFTVNVDEFLNALQLAIKAEILVLRNVEGCSLSFSKKPTGDEQWNYFEKLTQGEWKKNDDVFLYQFHEAEFNLADLTQFLLLTRLKKENMLKLAELDSRYKIYISKIFGEIQGMEGAEVANLEQAISFVFSEMEKKKITIRELAHQTGLSMVSVSNFKAGKDIRLSNFLKTLSVLKIKMKLE